MSALRQVYCTSLVCILLICNKALCAGNDDIEQRLKLLEDAFNEDEALLSESKGMLDKVKRAAVFPAVRPGNHSDSVVFQAFLNITYSTMSPYQTIQFNNIITNVGNAYDSNFGRFKAPLSGLYEFVLTATAYSSQMVNLEIVQNGVMLCRAHAGSSNYETGVCVSMVHLNIGDDVWVRHYNGQGTYIYNLYHPTFAGHLIKAD